MSSAVSMGSTDKSPAASRQPAEDFDEYVVRFPAAVQVMLREVRQTIRAAAPQSTEAISYGMPAFRFNRTVISFAAYAKHIGFYPGAAAIAHFKNELSAYKVAKGSVQFPIHQPLPVALIADIAMYRLRG